MDYLKHTIIIKIIKLGVANRNKYSYRFIFGLHLNIIVYL